MQVNFKQITQQWLVSKITPIHKKGPKQIKWVIKLPTENEMKMKKINILNFLKSLNERSQANLCEYFVSIHGQHKNRGIRCTKCGGICINVFTIIF